ncbi:CoA transferase [Salipiger marinus]|uniref:CoA transferase n=1 Tax=Salipiger marinus TaxID=555512 RepID=UPI002C185BA2|nr:CoA transferase [Salipiger manganoxidans]MEB3419301.1 CoA transferase [Salipiger manganoxidans]
MLLEGVSVVEWSDDIASQFAARLLTDMGATTLKLEPPGGSAQRRKGPFWPQQENGQSDPASAFFDFLNAGKSCRTAGSATQDAANELLGALETAGVLVESGLDAALGSQGITTESLRRKFPGLVVLSISPLGLEAKADVPDSDFLLQHRSGLTHCMARPVSDPASQPPLAAADHEAPLAVGVCGALSVVWGLLVAETGENAPRIDLASQDFYTSLLLDEFRQWIRGERNFARGRGPRQGVAPAGGISWLLPARNGYFMVSPREQHQWERWVEVLGSPDWARDRDLCGTVDVRKSQWEELLALMSDWSASQAAEDIAEKAQAAGVACFPVSRPAQLLSNAQLLHRQFFDRLSGPDGTKVPVPGLPGQIVTTSGRRLGRNRLL